MGIFAKEKTYTPAPEGLHTAVVGDVIDLGEVETQFGMKERVQIKFELDVINPDTNKRHVVSRRYNNSLHEKATLRRHIEGISGRRLTREELRGDGRGYDLETLVGQNCQLQIVHNSEGDRTFANIESVVPAAKGAPRMEVRDYVPERDWQGDQRSDSHASQDEKAAEVRDQDIPF